MKSAIIVLFVVLSIPSLCQASQIAWPPTSLPEDLIQFGSCQQLETHIEKLLAGRPMAYGRGEIGLAGGAKVMSKGAAASFDAPAALTQLSAASTPGNVVGTNNQVERVDEADFVKFNGRHIFQIHNGSLRILKAWPAHELNSLAAMPISGQAQDLLIGDSHAVVMASDGRTLNVTIVDVSNPASPRTLTEFQIPGHYRTARLIGDTLRIVSQEYNSIQNLWRPMTDSTGGAWLRDESAQRKLRIEPTIQLVGGQRRTVDVVKNCKNVLVPKSSIPNFLTRIISIDLRAKKYEETFAFVQPETVYASDSALYLAQSGYGQMGGVGVEQTAIYKFRLVPGQTAEYQATGVVDGRLINQFAMDEHKGNLRLATTCSERKRTSWYDRGSEWHQVSRVLVLAQSKRHLKMIGRSGDMGKGERLYSVRFDGDRGYVVTFRQVDPLYTLDLSNPNRPQVVGELKVPGFSTYIHRLDDHHLLTVGQDADEDTGRVRGLKLSVFNVRDFARPREIKSLVFKSDVFSESSHEHKAFTLYREKGVLAIPATQSQFQTRHSLLLFQVSPSGIKAAGELVMTDLAGVRRSFFADNFVYAIGANGVRAAAVNDVHNPVATVGFDTSVAEVSW